jgi:nucleoid DNA-binding protein
MKNKGAELPNLSKRNIAARLIERRGVHHLEAIGIVDEVFRTILDALAKGQDVQLRDYAIFRVVERKARMGRDPNKVGSEKSIPAHFAVKLKPGRLMEQAMAKLTSEASQ